MDDLQGVQIHVLETERNGRDKAGSRCPSQYIRQEYPMLMNVLGETVLNRFGE